MRVPLKPKTEKHARWIKKKTNILNKPIMFLIWALQGRGTAQVQWRLRQQLAATESLYFWNSIWTMSHSKMKSLLNCFHDNWVTVNYFIFTANWLRHRLTTLLFAFARHHSHSKCMTDKVSGPIDQQILF